MLAYSGRNNGINCSLTIGLVKQRDAKQDCNANILYIERSRTFSAFRVGEMEIYPKQHETKYTHTIFADSYIHIRLHRFEILTIDTPQQKCNCYIGVNCYIYM